MSFKKRMSEVLVGRSWRGMLFLLLLVATGPRALGQNAPTVSGTVRDSSGIAISNVRVKVIKQDTGAITEVQTDNQGTYQSGLLAPGNYRLEVNLDGFETVVRRITVENGGFESIDIDLSPARLNQGVIVTARRVEEEVQNVPIPVTVVSGSLVEDTGAFNVNRLKEVVPTVQFYSTNPRNSAINIRGLGAPFGLTNDGIEPGVGFYVDGVFYARPAAATLDFLDVDRVEVLRGPQGTLFGKNTTAGAINITTRRPSFMPKADFELSYGNLGFVQAKASITGPLIGKRVAGRLSFSGTQRNGTMYNTHTEQYVNTLNNLGVRASLLFAITDNVTLTLAVDSTRQRPNGYTQVVAGVAPTLRNPNRQYAQIAADLGYAPPSFNAFDRLTDIDTPLRSNQDLGGASATLDWNLGPGSLTSITAWRAWNWNPSSDRDFIGLPVTTISAAHSKQRQWTQEIRYAGRLNSKLNIVAGTFFFQQNIHSDPSFVQEQGSAAARFLLAPSANASTPGLLDGYGYSQFLTFDSISAAVFGQLEWRVTNRLRLLPGLRFNYDQKKVDFDQQVYGGLQTTNPALIALKNSVLAPQAYKAIVDDNNLSYQLTAAYSLAESANAYATFATGFKSVGLNLNGLPTDASDQAVLSAATVKPEDVHHFEFGVKTKPLSWVTANVAVYDTEVKNFQAQVMNAGVGVLRGYLANARKVRVRGVEFDGTARVNDNLSFYGSAAYTDGKYISFPDAPPPLEETGGPGFKDISGTLLPGISKWAASASGEYGKRAHVFGQHGQLFAALDGSYRSSFSSSPSVSQYLVVGGYPLFNARVGFRWADGWSLSVWSRNVLDKHYFELLTPVAGSSGLIVGQPGDPRTFGMTLRGSF